MKTKWFYPLQTKAEAMIAEKYDKGGLMGWQDVTPNRVYEQYAAIRKSDNKCTHIIVVMHKQTGFVHIYESIS